MTNPDQTTNASTDLEHRPARASEFSIVGSDGINASNFQIRW
jgi:hypothetical protein